MQKLAHTRLAEGELTGHYHEAVGPDVALWGDGTVPAVLEAPAGAEIRHQEHGTIKLPAGSYERVIVQEYDHFPRRRRGKFRTEVVPVRDRGT